jgi:hypothetical protein
MPRCVKGRSNIFLMPAIIRAGCTDNALLVVTLEMVEALTRYLMRPLRWVELPQKSSDQLEAALRDGLPPPGTRRGEILPMSIAT